jgi:hypothetical protein
LAAFFGLAALAGASANVVNRTASAIFVFIIVIGLVSKYIRAPQLTRGDGASG